jgi:ATP-binding protein involved in chromosome partitioning
MKPTNAKPPTIHAIDLSAVKNIIAVASGKGGVGKSTVAVNLAAALQAAGKAVGLLDADIYGPSVPRMLGLDTKPQINENKKFTPPVANGMKVMSMGLLVAEGAPMVWRGPMVQSAIIQMLKDVDWGALDYLIIDLPPGTGDVQLTLAQQIQLTGAVIVSTPQDIALIDARKAVAMFQRVGVPILGLVENMSYHTCTNCGHQSHIFGHGGARAEAEKLGVPLLAEIPLNADIRALSDAGTPAAWQDGEVAESYHALATAVAQRTANKIAIKD